MSAGGTELLPMNMMRRRNGHDVNADVDATADRFRSRFENGTVSQRKMAATTLVNEYYDLVTDFYEFGWGQNFHFASRYEHETFFESIARHEYYLALQAGFTDRDHVLDIGCGVGGPARNIVRLTQCHVTGINNNSYQIGRARQHDIRLGMDRNIDYVQTDFCDTGLEDNTFDGAYAIEATCHAHDRVKCYSEIYRIIKPGSYFVVYEWCLTDKFDPSNPQHATIKHKIELGNALPDLETTTTVLQYFKKAGFEVECAYDVIEKFDASDAVTIPWYKPLQGSYLSLKGLRSTTLGRWCTSLMCRVMEALHMAPSGLHKTSIILEEAATNLILGGELGIFTPSYFIKARKPLDG